MEKEMKEKKTFGSGEWQNPNDIDWASRFTPSWSHYSWLLDPLDSFIFSIVLLYIAEEQTIPELSDIKNSSCFILKIMHWGKYKKKWGT